MSTHEALADLLRTEEITKPDGTKEEKRTIVKARDPFDAEALGFTDIAHLVRDGYAKPLPPPLPLPDAPAKKGKEKS